MSCAIESGYVVIPLIVIETCLFVLSSEFFECKCGIINFHKQRKQSTKYQELDIASLMKSISVTFVMSVFGSRVLLQVLTWQVLLVLN